MKDRDKAKRKVLDYAERKERPILVGEVSLLLGDLCRLKAAEALISELVREGELRPTTVFENQSYDIRLGFVRCKKGK